jgi:anti-sigma B factor antagonist
LDDRILSASSSARPAVTTAAPETTTALAETAAAVPPAWAGSAAVLTTGDRTRLVLAGEVDASMNEELATCTTEITRLGGPLDVDVRNVTFMDSSVLAVIARLTQRLSGPVRVIGPSESVRFLLDLTHLTEVVEIHDMDPGAGPADGEQRAGTTA